MRIEPALFALGVFLRVGNDGALPHPDRTQAADPARIAQELALDAEALLAVVVDYEARPALAKFGIDVAVPQIERLEDMAVGIHHVVSEGHWCALQPYSGPASCYRSSADDASLNAIHGIECRHAASDSTGGGPHAAVPATRVQTTFSSMSS